MWDVWGKDIIGKISIIGYFFECMILVWVILSRGNVMILKISECVVYLFCLKFYGIKKKS